ncbi:unnamed protein product [Symbiodinium pilosum]|uniref:Uncharacterized protein n=1 Tax=Symbiodinium pilosum TaxID=2952 RepID=A0A812JMX9_SYMPI|nr:unnamed protein product [Symbiodinium pilosum]
MEAIDSELPAAPTKLTPVRASLSMGPSLEEDFETHENISYMLYHGDKSSDGSGYFALEVNVTAKDADLAASFVEHMNEKLKQFDMAQLVTVSHTGSTISFLTPLPSPDKANTDKNIQEIMKHVGHVTATVSVNNKMEHMLQHPDEPLWSHAKTGAKFLLDATLTDELEKSIVDFINRTVTHSRMSNCEGTDVPCVGYGTGQCCSLDTCLRPSFDDMAAPGYMQEQCKMNLTCAPVCAGSNPREYAVKLVGTLVQLFAGGSFDVKVAYDDDMMQDLYHSLPVANLTLTSLQEQYKVLSQHIPQDERGSPAALAAVELILEAGKALDSMDSVEVKGLPDGIKAVVKFENSKPFQFFLAILEGGGMLDALKGTTGGAPEQADFASAKS